LLHGLAFVGALGAAWLVFRLGGTGGKGGLTRLLLTGYAVGSVLAAILTMAMYVSGVELRQIFSFLLGGLGGSSWVRLVVAAPLIIGSSVLIAMRGRSLDGMLLGDAAARHLGIDVSRERGILLALASMATAAAVAISGLIGFVGLVVPHVVRLLVGPAAHRVLPISAIAGAALLLGLVLSLALVQTFLKPIRRLAEATAIIGKGKLNHTITIDSKDELGSLAADFNRMAVKLAELDQM